MDTNVDIIEALEQLEHEHCQLEARTKAFEQQLRSAYRVETGGAVHNITEDFGAAAAIGNDGKFRLSGAAANSQDRTACFDYDGPESEHHRVIKILDDILAAADIEEAVEAEQFDFSGYEEFPFTDIRRRSQISKWTRFQQSN